MYIYIYIYNHPEYGNIIISQKINILSTSPKKIYISKSISLYLDPRTSLEGTSPSKSYPKHFLVRYGWILRVCCAVCIRIHMSLYI